MIILLPYICGDRVTLAEAGYASKCSGNLLYQGSESIQECAFYRSLSLVAG
jgi:hypothetical protein